MYIKASDKYSFNNTENKILFLISSYNLKRFICSPFFLVRDNFSVPLGKVTSPKRSNIISQQWSLRNNYKNKRIPLYKVEFIIFFGRKLNTRTEDRRVQKNIAQQRREEHRIGQKSTTRILAIDFFASDLLLDMTRKAVGQIDRKFNVKVSIVLFEAKSQSYDNQSIKSMCLNYQATSQSCNQQSIRQKVNPICRSVTSIVL